MTCSKGNRGQEKPFCTDSEISIGFEDDPARGEGNKATGGKLSPKIAPSSSQVEGSFEVKMQHPNR